MEVSSTNQSQSLGPANQLFLALIQALTAAQYSISPPNRWPADSGPYEPGTSLAVPTIL